jgi:peptidoglycan/LPS O-acetylase OafA/YrhL
MEILDVWRALAILPVVAFHFLVRYRPAYDASTPDLVHLHGAYVSAFEIGRYGVQLFFIISGVVIAMTLSRSSGPAEFAFRRFSRLMPAYLVATIVTFAIVHLMGPHELQVNALDLALAWAKPILDFGYPGVDGAAWSLRIEVEFYIGAGALYYFMGRRAWVGTIVVALLGDVIFPFSPRTVDVLLPSHLCFFMAGVAAWLGLVEGRRVAGAMTGFVALATFAMRLGACLCNADGALGVALLRLGAHASCTSHAVAL